MLRGGYQPVLAVGVDKHLQLVARLQRSLNISCRQKYLPGLAAVKIRTEIHQLLHRQRVVITYLYHKLYIIFAL